MLDPGDLIAEFASAITDDLDPDVAELGDDLDDCETQLDADKVFELRRTVTRVRVAVDRLSPLPRARSAPRSKSSRRCRSTGCDDDDRLHLSAAADRAARMAEELESIRERAALMHETLTDLRAEQIDQRSLIISIAAMIFLPLTFLTGLYGMNVDGLWLARRALGVRRDRRDLRADRGRRDDLFRPQALAATVRRAQPLDSRRVSRCAVGADVGEFGARLAQFHRARGDPRVERGVRALEVGDPPRARQRALDPRRQHVEIERLGEMIVGARRPAPRPRRRVRCAR